MARTLPWLNKSAAATNNTRSSSPAPKRRKRESSLEDLVDADLNDVATPPPRAKHKKRADRTPSTSPAPAAPPDVEYMRPGYSADDRYLMVEDAFHSIATEFTKHLHYGEYVRLKKLSKSRGEKTLSAVGHGTDDRTEKSKAVQKEEEKEASERKMMAALGLDSEDEEELPFMQDPQLAGLMGKDRGNGVGRALAGMVKAKSKTRAAAGFVESPHAGKRHRDALSDQEDAGERGQKPARASSSKVPKVFEEVSEDDEDGLDAVQAPVQKPESKWRAQRTGEDRSSRQETTANSSDNVFKGFAAPSRDDRSSTPNDLPKQMSAPEIKVDDEEDTFEAPRPKPVRPSYKKAQNRQASQALDTQDPTPRRSPLRPTGSENGLFRRASISSSKTGDVEPVLATSPTKTSPSAQLQGKAEAKAAAADYLAKRAAERARKEREQQGRAKRVDEIPTFLF